MPSTRVRVFTIDGAKLRGCVPQFLLQLCQPRIVVLKFCLQIGVSWDWSLLSSGYTRRLPRGNCLKT